METTKKEDEVVNEQEQLQGKASDQSKSSSKKSQGGQKQEQEGVEAQKAEGKGQAKQRGAVGEEFEADRANHKKDGNGGGKGNPASSKGMPDSPDTGKSVEKNGAKDKEAVDQYSKSKGKKKADENTDGQPNSKDKGGKEKPEEDKKSKDKKGQQEASASDKENAKGGKKKGEKAEEEKDGKKKGEKAEEEKDGKKKDKEAKAEEKAEKAGVKKGEEGGEAGGGGGASAGKEEKKSGKEKGSKVQGGNVSLGSVSSAGGGGGAEGGAVNIPSLGGGAPTVPAPKGEGAGDSAIEAYANSGLSYQAENYGGLGGKVDADVAKAETELNEKLPGEEGVEAFDAAKDAELVTKGSGLQAKNDSVSGDDYDANSGADIDGIVESSALNVEAQKSTYENAGDENMPDCPTVEASGAEGIDAICAEEAAKFATAKADGPAKAAELERTLPERGFDDVKVQKIDLDLESEGMTTGEVSITAAVAELTDEGKGLLDISEVAEQVSADMEDVKAQAKEADEKREADIQAKIDEHDQAVEEAMQEAEQAEAEGRETRQQEIESQIETDTATYDSEITSFDIEQQAEIDAGNSEIEQERQAAQTEINQEHAKAKQEEQKTREEGQKKEKENKSLWDHVVDAGKAIGNALSSAWEWVKSTVSGIVKGFLNFVSNALQKFANKVREIAGRVFNAIKEKWNQFKEKLSNFLNKLKDFIVEKWNQFVDWVKEQVNKLVEGLKALGQLLLDGLKALWEGFKALLKGILTVVSSILAQAAKFFMGLIKKACELVGVDGSFLDQAMAVAEEIIKDPGAFASTMIDGFVLGFKNFGANIVENVIKIFKNLINLWLGTVGAKLPGEFNVPNIIQMVLDMLGINATGIIEALGFEDGQDFYEGAKDLVAAVQKDGIKGIIPFIQDSFGSLAEETRNAIIEAIVTKAATAALTKLASMSNPASGIVTAIKAVWDLIQFVRDNMSAISGLLSAIGNVIVAGAQGDSATVASAVEASLCQAIPLVIDLFLRIAGINVGGELKKIVGKIQERIKKVVDGLINSLRQSNNKLVRKGANKINNSTERENKTKQDKETAERRDKAQHEGFVTNKKNGNAWQKFGARAGLAGERLNTALDGMKSYKKGMVFNPTGLTGALNGNKEGNLGVNLNNSKTVKAIDKYHEEKRENKKKEQYRAQQEQQLKDAIQNATGPDGKVDTSKLTSSQLKAYRKQLIAEEQARRDADNGLKPKENKPKEEKSLWQYVKDDKNSRDEKEAKAKKERKAQKEEQKRYMNEGHSREDANIRSNVLANSLENHNAISSVRAGRAYESYKSQKKASGESYQAIDKYTENYHNLEKAREAKQAYSSGTSKEDFNADYTRRHTASLWNNQQKANNGISGIIDDQAGKMGETAAKKVDSLIASSSAKSDESSAEAAEEKQSKYVLIEVQPGEDVMNTDGSVNKAIVTNYMVVDTETGDVIYRGTNKAYSDSQLKKAQSSES